MNTLAGRRAIVHTVFGAVVPLATDALRTLGSKGGSVPFSTRLPASPERNTMALRGTLDHHKTIALADRLRIPPCYALGVLEAFWHFVARQRPDGDITGISPKHMCSAMKYRTPRSSQVFVALVESGFIDKVGERYIVHDWHVHADQAVKKWLARNNKKFAYYSVSGHCPSMSGHCPDMSVLPESSIQNPEPIEAFHLRGVLQTLHEYGGHAEEREGKNGSYEDRLMRFLQDPRT